MSTGEILEKQLLRHREAQRESLDLLEIQQDVNTPVLCGQLGQLIFGDKTSSKFSKILHKSGFGSDYTFHTLRHTHCTMLLQDGAPIETVSKRVGHVDSITTLRTYSHVMRGQGEAVSRQFNKLIGAIYNKYA